MDANWIRLNIDWDQSPWLALLRWEVRTVWVPILCHVKAFGKNGCCREPMIERWAQGKDIPQEHIEALRNAAVTAGALRVTDGEWHITNWEKYQGGDSTNAERQARFREARRVENEAKDQVRNALRNGSNGTLPYPTLPLQQTVTGGALHAAAVVAITGVRFWVNHQCNATDLEAAFDKARSHGATEQAILEQLLEFKAYYGNIPAPPAGTPELYLLRWFNQKQKWAKCKDSSKGRLCTDQTPEEEALIAQ